MPTRPMSLFEAAEDLENGVVVSWVISRLREGGNERAAKFVENGMDDQASDEKRTAVANRLRQMAD